MKKFYYSWGNEQPGYVSVWKYGKNGEIIHLKNIKKAEALKLGYSYDCPFN